MKLWFRLSTVLLLCAGLLLARPAVAAPCIDVETASAKELQKLKGVGPALAKAIVNYRKKMRTAATKAKKAKWLIRNWATLYKVTGVGPQICKDNLTLVCFSGKVQKACPKPAKKK